MHALFTEFGLDETQQKVGIGRIFNLGGPIASRADLTEAQGLVIVESLEERKAAQTPAAEPPLDDPTADDSWPASNGR